MYTWYPVRSKINSSSHASDKGYIERSKLNRLGMSKTHSHVHVQTSDDLTGNKASNAATTFY